MPAGRSGNGADFLIVSCQQIEDYWAVYSHLKRPHELPNISDYHEWWKVDCAAEERVGKSVLGIFGELNDTVLDLPSP
jgi:hypothetical protein